jgi:hypothetical protein
MQLDALVVCSVWLAAHGALQPLENVEQEKCARVHAVLL